MGWGGCFLQARAEPAIGEHVEVVALIGERETTLSGSVVYLEKPIGFSIQFDPLTAEQIDVMKALLGAPPTTAA